MKVFELYINPKTQTAAEIIIEIEEKGLTERFAIKSARPPRRTVNEKISEDKQRGILTFGLLTGQRRMRNDKANEIITVTTVTNINICLSGPLVN